MNPKAKEDLVKMVVQKTMSSELKWVKSNNLFNSDTCHYFICDLTPDTKVETDITLEDDLTLKKYNSGISSIRVKNKNLLDGSLYLAASTYPDLQKIGNFLYTLYIKPNLGSMSTNISRQNDAIDSILSYTSVEDKRDRRINDLLGNTSTAKFVPTFKQEAISISNETKIKTENMKGYTFTEKGNFLDKKIKFTHFQFYMLIAASIGLGILIGNLLVK